MSTVGVTSCHLGTSNGHHTIHALNSSHAVNRKLSLSIVGIASCRFGTCNRHHTIHGLNSLQRIVDRT